MLGNIFQLVWLSGGLLAGLLIAGVLSDLTSRRIPNLLVGVGLLLGLLLNSLLPEGFGLFNPYGPGGIGLLNALGGVVVAGGMLLPLYTLKAMGAGDVKLMGMVGAFLTPMQAFWAVLAVFIAGGLLGLLFAFRKDVAVQTFNNLRALLTGAFSSILMREKPDLSVAGESAARMPYSLAIATGTLFYLVFQYQGWLKG